MLEGAWLPSEHAGSGPGGRARVWNMERGRKSGKRGKRKAWIAQRRAATGDSVGAPGGTSAGARLQYAPCWRCTPGMNYDRIARGSWHAVVTDD